MSQEITLNARMLGNPDTCGEWLYSPGGSAPTCCIPPHSSSPHVASLLSQNVITLFSLSPPLSPSPIPLTSPPFLHQNVTTLPNRSVAIETILRLYSPALALVETSLCRNLPRAWISTVPPIPSDGSVPLRQAKVGA